MKVLFSALAATALVLGTVAEAKNDKNRGQGAHAASRAGCPPGLAKKNPPCIPPGLAKRGVGAIDADDGLYQIGDFIDGDYVILDWPADYGLDPYGHYLHVGGYVYRVNRETRVVLEIIGALANLLN